jgi:hypothetical protein
MGSHKGGSYPLQESSRKSVEPKQDKQVMLLAIIINKGAEETYLENCA